MGSITPNYTNSDAWNKWNVSRPPASPPPEATSTQPPHIHPTTPHQATFTPSAKQRLGAASPSPPARSRTSSRAWCTRAPRYVASRFLEPQRRAAALTFSSTTALGLHLGGTGGCTNCCKQPPSQPYYFPFEVMAPNGTWLGASVAAVRGNTVRRAVTYVTTARTCCMTRTSHNSPSHARCTALRYIRYVWQVWLDVAYVTCAGLARRYIRHVWQVWLDAPAAISAVRHNWGGYPDCSLYSGVGGPDNRSALAAAPFRRCLYGATADLPPWSYYSDCNQQPTHLVPLVPPGGVAPIPTSSLADLVLLGVTPTRWPRSPGRSRSPDRPRGTYRPRGSYRPRGAYRPRGSGPTPK